MPTPSRSLVRSAADLTGELFRRHQYPSAYGGFGDVWKCDWLKDSRIIEVSCTRDGKVVFTCMIRRSPSK
ncbi:hypothetical protein L210DRAFT_3546616 [Boletus edulis BED1]|uniref:Uncharacterized protein n=1 Tax=Boletus edulis BED1 TaxID=1328754 RepID=A0AAD4BR33_BOLED|nr:hypothetical protein L210DRAFT_3546616 [Boletus edulis BED1]